MPRCIAHKWTVSTFHCVFLLFRPVTQHQNQADGLLRIYGAETVELHTFLVSAATC